MPLNKTNIVFPNGLNAILRRSRHSPTFALLDGKQTVVLASRRASLSKIRDVKTSTMRCNKNRAGVADDRHMVEGRLPGGFAIGAQNGGNDPVMLIV
jgi:hypothetical protein